MTPRFSGSLLLALTLFATSPASADITRGCAGEVWMTFGEAAKHKVTLAKVDARGTCKNRLNANDCRLRALSAMRTCMADLWAGRHKSELPASCQTYSGTGRPHAGLTWQGIIPNRNPTLKTRIEYYTCCTPRKRTRTFDVFLTWTAHGDKGCGGTLKGTTAFSAQEVIHSRYVANCQALRNQGLCGEPVRGN